MLAELLRFRRAHLCHPNEPLPGLCRRAVLARGITSESEELICALIRNMALECYRQWVRAGKVVPMEEAAQILGSMTLHSVEHLA